MAGPETEGPDGQAGADGAAADDVVRPGSGVVRPGTGVVRPGTGVVRPGSGHGAAGNAGVVRPGTNPDGAAKAVAAVPDASEKPLEPIHVVLPVIEVKPAKQGFLDRLVAGKSEAERAAEEARKEEEARRKAEEAERKAEEKARRAESESRRKAAEKARKQAEEERRAAAEERRAAAEAEQKARAEAEERARREGERQREREKADERARREQERALRQAREADEREDDDYDEAPPARGPVGPSAPPRPGPQGPPQAQPRGAPGPATPSRPGPMAPPGGPGGSSRPGTRPGPGRPMPERDRRGRGGQRYEDERYRDERYAGDGYDDERYEEPRRRPLWKWVVAGVALIGLGGGSAAVAGVIAPSPGVKYQPAIDTGVQAPILGSLDTGAPVPSGTGLDAALGSLAASPNLGPNPAVAVADAVTGQVLWQRNSESTVVPASATKVLTAAAVLGTLGPNHRISTRVVAGANPGEVVIIGGGDPTLSAANVPFYRGAPTISDLAQQVRTSLGGTAPTRVIIDGSLFSGSTVGPSGAGNVGVAVAHVTALMTDGARVDPSYRGDRPSYHSQPDMVAGRQLAAALGVAESQVSRGAAPGGARVLGEVFSPPLASITEEMLANSDNTAAEMLARQVAIARGRPASFDGGAAATREALAELGVPLPADGGLADGSGLSRDNKVTARFLVSLLVRAASVDHPELRALVSGLAVAGYSGTLDDRAEPAGRGVVRAKTGTLTGVNALVGYVVDVDGRLLAFAAVGNGTPGFWAAEPALDRLAAALASCGCR